MALKFFIKTYGCQMNERDSEASAAALMKAGYTPAKNENEADILLFNTCSVRDQAERKAVGKIGIMKKNKKRNPNLIIGVVGCMAQNKKEKLFRELPHIDFILGTDKLHTLVETIRKEETSREKCIHTEFDSSKDALEGMDGHLILSSENQEGISEIVKGNSCSAFVALMRGCNRFCSYCIVPYVRGREKSRTPNSILEECRMLADKGIKELMLLGQNVAAYGYPPGQLVPAGDESPFAELLKEIAEITGIERIRFTSPHPACFNDKLIDTIGELEKVCDNIHLPLQSGSDQILTAMGRGYTAEKYLSIVNKLKKHHTETTFSTDIIVGFPGETEEDFNATRKIMETVGFDNAFIFKFSPRTGTKAAELEDSVPQKIKEERNAVLLQVLKNTTGKHNRKLIGTTQKILVEGISKRNSERWYGRTTTNKVTVFTPYQGITPGDIIEVQIDKATEMTLFGTVKS